MWKEGLGGLYWNRKVSEFWCLPEAAASDILYHHFGALLSFREALELHEIYKCRLYSAQSQ